MKIKDKLEFIALIKGKINHVIFAPIPLIRRKHILNRLRKCGATSKETAKKLSEAGVINPNAFKTITEKLIKKYELGRTDNNKYYLL